MRFSLIALALLAFVSTSLRAEDGPRLIYSKSFPGSIPAFTEITVEPSGAAVYKEDPKDENPIQFQLTKEVTNQVFDLTKKLDNFTRPLESGLNVAKMGDKTFRYEAGSVSHHVTFNYSADADARTLNDLFEQMAQTERAYIALETAVRFDKLGAQDAILRIEVLRDQNRLIAPQQFLPMLDRVTKNQSFIHLARDRAAALAESIRKTM